jgi:hypothetical protein
MKRNALHTALGILVLSGSALFATAAQADSARISLSFGDFCPPANVVGFGNPHPHGAPHHAAGHDGRPPHDGFGPVSGLDRRQQRQHARIVQGVRSGELTPYELRQVRQEQREIRYMERRYLADGHLSPREWHRLDQKLDAASRNIWRQKHDNSSRY